MDQLELPNTGRRTTRLGFGLAYLLPETAHVLDAAYDAGIRHFDVARSYGRGRSERILGKFLAQRPDTTVTSKYGILPAYAHPAVAIPRAVLRPLLRPILQRLRRALPSPPTVGGIAPPARGPAYRKAAFTAEDARTSLELTRRNLRRERVDVFLMHEATPQDLCHDALLAFLQRQVADGTIGAFGVGGESDRTPRLVEVRKPYCGVLQYEWTAAEPIITHPGTFSIVYRTFGTRFDPVRRAIETDPALCRKWSDAVGMDLSAAATFNQLMLRAALDSRPNDIVLFSSTKPANILANVRTAEDSSLSEPALALAALVRERISPTAG